MSKLKEMRDRFYGALPAEADAIIAKAKAENRDPSDDEVGRLEALDAESKTLKASMDAEERRARAVTRFAAHPTAPEGMIAGSSRIEVGEDNRTKAPWASLGDFAQAVAGAYTPNNGERDPRLFAAVSGLSQSIPSDGGFLVPPEYSQSIWDGMNRDPYNLLALTDQYPVTGESLTFNANAETSRAIGSLYGGVQAYWIAEADQITKSKPKFRQVKVEPQQLAVLCYATDKVLKNAPALNAWISRAASAAIVHEVNHAIIEGTGAGQPRGILGAASTVSVAKETNQAAVTVLQENVSKMWARLHPNARMNAIWLHNVDVEPALDTLSTVVKNVAGSENVGGYSNKVFDSERRTLKGRPLVPCEFCATLGTVGDLVLWDPKSYFAGVRGGVDSAMSMHLRFDFAETCFRFIFEVDGTPWLASAITPAKGSNTLTTQITLATRA